MRGDYYGYLGPGPPWNDALVHHYVFTVYGLDVPHLEVRSKLTGTNVRLRLPPRARKAQLDWHLFTKSEAAATLSPLT